MEYDYDSFRDYYQKGGSINLTKIRLLACIPIIIGFISLFYDVLIKETLIALMYIIVGLANFLFPEKAGTWFKDRDYVRIDKDILKWKFEKVKEEVELAKIEYISKLVGTLKIELNDGRYLFFPSHKIYSKDKFEEFNKNILPRLYP